MPVQRYTFYTDWLLMSATVGVVRWLGVILSLKGGLDGFHKSWFVSLQLGTLLELGPICHHCSSGHPAQYIQSKAV